MKSSRPASAHCMSSKTRIVGRCSASRSKRIRQAEKRFSWSPAARPRARAGGRGAARPSAFLGVGDVLLERRAELLARRRRRPRPRRSRSASAPSRRAPSRRRPRRRRGSGRDATRRRREAVDVLLELPGEPRLADSGDPGDETSCARRSSADAWKSSLISRSSRSRPTNGASSPVERIGRRARDDAQARQSGTGSALPFSSCGRRRRTRSRPRSPASSPRRRARCPARPPTGCARRC